MYDKMTKAQLLALLEERGIEATKRARKATLVALLEAQDERAPEKAPCCSWGSDCDCSPNYKRYCMATAGLIVVSFLVIAIIISLVA